MIVRKLQDDTSTQQQTCLIIKCRSLSGSNGFERFAQLHMQEILIRYTDSAVISLLPIAYLDNDIPGIQ